MNNFNFYDYSSDNQLSEEEIDDELIFYDLENHRNPFEYK